MRKKLEYIWPAVGLLAVVFSFWLLYEELRWMSAQDIVDSLYAITSRQYLLAFLSTIVAYWALAWYDRIALLHLGVNHISWVFVTLCSFTTYALAHNIGASVFSGAMVRYRAYSSKGLSGAQIAVLVGLCSFTFILGTIILGGVVLTANPRVLMRLDELLPDILISPTAARLLGIAMLGFVALYVLGSVLRMRPLTIRAFRLEYPRPEITVRQLIAAPLELLGAAGIIYFALPELGNPGYFVVLAVFLASFSAALISHAPGGLGVFELVFITAMPDVPPDEVLAALLVFRLYYLLIPLALSLVVVTVFERRRLTTRWTADRNRKTKRSHTQK
ncbi:MAG TPA: lysylphosphatidylglycerol synthase domain-containing protein [Saliniramus sp.]|nr:lysylphosphatidylglycerol synthase domain-containing protein [Saliniramus sp.]